ncbi:hypothetical protein ACFQU2_03880 [Siccirubricoccus deserti]
MLDGLELGSRFTWDLTHKDLLCDEPFYSRGKESPYVFILCGTEGYGGIRHLAREEGSDGTVRWAGCSLDTRKITLNLARDPAMSADVKAHRANSRDIEAIGALPMPFWPIAGKNHGTIVSEPDGPLVDLVLRALSVEEPDEFDKWQEAADAATKEARAKLERWQQFVVRVMDERQDPVRDFHIELFTRGADGDRRAIDFDADVHLYRADPSFRCFHISHDRLLKDWGGVVPDNLWVRLIASSGSELVGFHGVNSSRIREDGTGMDPEGVGRRVAVAGDLRRSRGDALPPLHHDLCRGDGEPRPHALRHGPEPHLHLRPRLERMTDSGSAARTSGAAAVLALTGRHPARLGTAPV